MIHEHQYICPKCGLVLDSLTGFHLHFKKEHETKKSVVS